MSVAFGLPSVGRPSCSIRVRCGERRFVPAFALCGAIWPGTLDQDLALRVVACREQLKGLGYEGFERHRTGIACLPRSGQFRRDVGRKKLKDLHWNFPELMAQVAGRARPERKIPTSADWEAMFHDYMAKLETMPLGEFDPTVVKRRATGALTHF